jgi:hypothetical protein
MLQIVQAILVGSVLVLVPTAFVRSFRVIHLNICTESIRVNIFVSFGSGTSLLNVPQEGCYNVAAGLLQGVAGQTPRAGMADRQLPATGQQQHYSTPPAVH